MTWTLAPRAPWTPPVGGVLVLSTPEEALGKTYVGDYVSRLAWDPSEVLPDKLEEVW